MFTGIITHLGKLSQKSEIKYTFQASKGFCNRITKGSSVAVNGVCLTILKKPTNDSFSVEIMPETAKKTMLERLKIRDLVNLELPVSPTQFLSGHIVQGHIDGIGKIAEIKKDKNSKILTIKIPPKLEKYIAEKGSVTINGISLTVIESQPNYFTVGIIPYTWSHTMLYQIKIGDFVNIEVDILAKYLEKLVKDTSFALTKHMSFRAKRSVVEESSSPKVVE